MESRKTVLMNLFAGKGCRCREQTSGHSGGRKKRDRESSINTGTPPRMKSTAGEKLLCNTRSSARRSVLAQKGGMPEGRKADLHCHRAETNTTL